MDVVKLEPGYYPDPNIGRPVANADIYVGNVDTDPEIPGNQKTISVRQENGTVVPVTQPMHTGAGGVPEYNGSTVTILVDGPYSLKVNDSVGAQVYYVPESEVSISELIGKDHNEDGSHIVFENLADLRASTLTPFHAQKISLLGYTEAGDKVSNDYAWNSTDTTADDGGDTIKVTAITTGRFKLLRNKIIDIDDFGAVNDGGITDNADSINSAITVAETGDTILFPVGAGGGYGSSTGITIPESINVEMKTPLIYTGSLDIACLTIGQSGVANSEVLLRINVQRETQSDWTSDSSIGALLYNVSTSTLWLDQADGFTRGFVLAGADAGFAYNNLFVRSVLNNKYGIDIRSTDAAGYVNENLFIGGRFSVFTGINTTDDRYGVRITSTNGFYNDNNIFIKPAFEMRASDTTGEAVGITFLYGTLSQVIGARNEDNDYVARFQNDSNYNSVDVLFGPATWDDLTGPQDNFVNIQRDIAKKPASVIFYSGDLHGKACYYDGATNVNIPSVHIGNSSNANIASNLNSITIGTNYVELPSARTVGIFVDTSIQKRFILRKGIVEGYGGITVIRAYDSSGTVLTDSDPGHPYVYGSIIASLNWSTDYGGSYKTGTDSDDDIYFRVTDDVAYVAVELAGGPTNDLRIKSFSVESSDGGNPNTWVGYEEIVSGENIGSVAPTAGTWETGRVVYDSTPLVDNRGWQCSAGGTPGTWFVIK